MGLAGCHGLLVCKSELQDCNLLLAAGPDEQRLEQASASDLFLSIARLAVPRPNNPAHWWKDTVAACSLVNMQRRNSRCMKLHGESDLVTDTMLDHKSSVIEGTGGRVRDAMTDRRG